MTPFILFSFGVLICHGIVNQYQTSCHTKAGLNRNISYHIDIEVKAYFCSSMLVGLLFGKSGHF